MKVTLIVGGKTTDVLFVRIAAIDPEAGLVGLSTGKMHEFPRLDIEDSEYSVEPSRLVVTRNESDWLTFEELS